MRLNFKSAFLVFGVLIGWFALIFQLDIAITNSVISLLQTLGKYFSYFTILTNIMVAVAFSFMLFTPGSRWGIFFDSARVFTAITVYMIVVGAIYNIILRPLTNPEGFARLIDEIMHVIMPLMTLIYWIFFIKKDAVEWKHIWSWLIYPLLYICIILLAGNSSMHYPYPFINVTELGYQKVFINSAGVALVFAILSILMVGISKVISKNKS